MDTCRTPSRRSMTVRRRRMASRSMMASGRRLARLEARRANPMSTLQTPTAEQRMVDAATDLRSKIENKTAIVGVAGIGYVGLPLAVEKAKVGYTVIGYDRNAIRVAQVNQGSNYIRDVDDDDLGKAVTSGRLSATTDFSTLGVCDVIVICVPTPLTANKDPDVSFIRAVGSEV